MEILPFLHEECTCTPLLNGFFFLVLKVLLIISGIESNPGPKNGHLQSISTNGNKTISSESKECTEKRKNTYLLEKLNAEILDKNEQIRNLVEEVKDLKIKLNKLESEIQSLNSHKILREQISHSCATENWVEVKKHLKGIYSNNSVEYRDIVKSYNANLPVFGVQNGYVLLVHTLLIHGLPVNRGYRGIPNGNSLLHIAAIYGQVDVAKLLITHGADVNMKNSDTLTPLHYAAGHGFVETVKVLLDYGAFVDTSDKTGVTALHMAAHYDKVSVVKCLLSNKCNKSLTNKSHETALDIAKRLKNHEVIAALSS